MVEYSFEIPVDPESLLGLFRQTTWAGRRTPETVAALLANSTLKLGAWDGDRLIGFARALSDGACRALIDDVVVDGPARGRKIGDELMRRLLERLAGIEEIVLLCDPSVAAFYHRYGFKAVTCESLSLKRT